MARSYNKNPMSSASAEITIRYNGEKRTFRVTGAHFKQLVGILSRGAAKTKSWRYVPPETVSDIKQLYRSGWSMAAIAAEKGMTYNAVYSLLMRMRQFQAKPNFNEKQKQQIIDEYHNGATVIELANKYDCSRTAIYKWLKERKCSKEDTSNQSMK